MAPSPFRNTPITQLSANHMEKMNAVKKVIIIGGGPAGLAAALHLRLQNNIEPVIYELRKQPTTLGGAVGIPPNGLRLLHRLGLYDAVKALGASTPNLKLRSVKGKILGEMSQVSWSEQQTGFGYLRIRRGDLMTVLLGEAAKVGIEVCYGKELTSIVEDDSRVTVTFKDGLSDSADFLLGCDGIHSSVRKLYIDPETTPQYSRICNMFSLVPSEKLPNFSEFDQKAINAVVTTDGLVAVTAATTNSDTLYWFFSREVALPATGDTRDGWEERGKKEVSALKSTVLALVQDSQGGWGDFIRAVIESTETVKFYPIFKMPRDTKWARGRCLLIGDSAHAMPPHASQGVSMALEDVFMFAQVLKSEHTIQDGISVYEKKRRARVEEMQNLAERNGTVRKKLDPLRLWVNELGISVALSVYKLCYLEKLGLGQGPLVYDVEEDVITGPNKN